MQDIQYRPTRALVEQVQGKDLLVNETTKVKLGLTLSAEIKAGSRWVFVGAIPEGDVYKAKGSVFSLEGAQIHEAYLVIAGETLTGFYLPYEKGYSPAVTLIRLNTSRP